MGHALHAFAGLLTVSDTNKKGFEASTNSWVGTTARTDSADLGKCRVAGVSGFSKGCAGASGVRSSDRTIVKATPNYSLLLLLQTMLAQSLSHVRANRSASVLFF